MSEKYVKAVIISLVAGGLIAAATYYIGHSDPKITCTPHPAGAVPQSIQWQSQWDDAHPPIPAREKGFPLTYYRDSSVSRASSAYGESSADRCSLDANVKTGLIARGLIIDYLIWSAAAFIICSCVILMTRGKS